jgi:hypothetical protein
MNVLSGDVTMTHNEKVFATAGYSVFCLPKPKLNSEQKAENIFVAPPYCQCIVSFSLSFTW